MKKKITKGEKLHSYSSEKIVQDVKKHIKTASDLYEQYIEAHASLMIDPVTNAEYLKEGWSDNIIHNDTLVKKVEDTFSFVMNVKKIV